MSPSQIKRAPKGSLKGLLCTVPECQEPVYAKNMCRRHYKQLNRNGEAKRGLSGKHGAPEERFWHFVQKAGPDECWPWTGFRDKDGYGSFRAAKGNQRAHRISYAMHNPDQPIDGLVVRHTCHNPPCVNPAHLLHGTHQDNVDDRVRAGRCPVNESHGNTKFSNAVVEAVRAAVGTHKEIGQQFGISRDHVGLIRRMRARPPEAARQMDIEDEQREDE